jgi:predicted TIM-barrel fold metal-dependent hydrolase
MEIVDGQVHIGAEGFAPMVAQMDALGIKAALLDEFWFRNESGQQMPGYPLAGGAWRCVSPIAEQAALLHPDRFAYLQRVNLRDPDLTGLIGVLAASPHARALRLQPLGDAQAFAAGAYDGLFGLAQAAGLPIFIFLAGMVELLSPHARKFPDLTFIIDHCGMPWAPKDIGYFDEVLRLAAHPNVALKWAHAQNLFSAASYPYTPLMAHLRRAIDAFGAERVIWASDHSQVKEHSWSDLLHYVRDAAELTAPEKASVLGGSLRKLIGWPAASGASA